MKKTVTSAGGVIIKDKKILLIKRAATEKRFPGCWSCPGGKQDPGEELEQTVKREIREEICIDFSLKEKFGEYKTELEDIYVIQHIFLGSFAGTPNPNQEEVEECRWFAYGEAKDLDFAFSYKKVMDNLHDKGLI